MKRRLDGLLKSNGVSIVFEDDALIVLEKPAPFLVLPDRYDETIPNLYGILNVELGKVFVVHRIDKETSGLIVFAKTAEVHKNLSEQFESHSVVKGYEAIVKGYPERDKERIDLPLREKIPGVMAVDRKKGKPSVTTYRVIRRFEGFAHLAMNAETGRMHQIRVHLKAAGLPILGDAVYGDGEGFYVSQVKANYKLKINKEMEEDVEEKPILSRTALHASALTFKHPFTGSEMSVQSALPKDMRSVVRTLVKYKPMRGF